MSKLVAMIFDDQYKADEARAAIYRLQGEGQIEIGETAIIVKYPDGKGRFSQDINIVGKGRRLKVILGLVGAAITGTMPFFLRGTVGGELIGKLTEHEITNNFVKVVTNKLKPGTSVLLMLANFDNAILQKLSERVHAWCPVKLVTDLPSELVKEIEDNLLEEQPTGSA